MLRNVKQNQCALDDYYDYCIYENTHNIRYFSYISIITFIIYFILSFFVSDLIINKELHQLYLMAYASLVIFPVLFIGMSFIRMQNRIKRILNSIAMVIFGTLLIFVATLDFINKNEIPTFIILVTVFAVIYHENTKIIFTILIFFGISMIFELLYLPSDKTPFIEAFDVTMYTLIAVALSIITSKAHYKLYCTSKVLEEKSVKLEEMSFKDSLTGLHNRRYLFSILENECKRFTRHRGPFSIILFDLDHFKKINDIYGHVVGDEVLSKIGELLKKEFRSVDITTRYGGEEFMIVLVETPLSSAYLAAERLRNKMEKYPFPSVLEPITASFGVAEYPGNCDIETFISIADKKLYKAKHSGRNQVVK